MNALGLELQNDIWAHEDAGRDPLALEVYKLVRYRIAHGLQHPVLGDHKLRPMVDFGTATLVGVVKRLSSAKPTAKFHKDLAFLMRSMGASRVRTGSNYLETYDPEVATKFNQGEMIGGPHKIEETEGAGGLIVNLIEAHLAAEEPALLPLLQITTEAGSRDFFARGFSWKKRATPAAILRDYKPAASAVK